MAVQKVQVEGRRQVGGASFGAADARGEWIMPEDQADAKQVRDNFRAWQAEQNQTTSGQFAAAQKTRTLAGQYQERLSRGAAKINIEREQTERQLYQDFKASPKGSDVRSSLASGVRNTRNAGVRSGEWVDGRAQKYIGRKVGARAVGRKVGNYAAARVKVTVANAWITSWVLFFYFTIQLPFAILSSAGLGITAYIYSVAESFTQTTIGNLLFYVFGGALVRFIENAVVSAMNFFFGIAVDPMVLFLLPFLLVFALGLMQLILSWFVYSILGIKSLSGQAASAKVGLFLLAIVGTVVPFLNLLPLIALWTAIVWIKPK